MKYSTILSLVSLAVTVAAQADDTCPPDITSTITVSAAAAATSAADFCDGEPVTITSTVTVTAGAGAGASATAVASAAPAPAVSSAAAGAASGTNVQKFTGTLGGPPPPVVSSTGDRPFSVNGNTFTGAGAAIGRSCDIQHNACANAANSGSLSGGVGQCDVQNTACRAANGV